MPKVSHLTLVVCLLLVHFFLRTRNITQFEPYVDEGYHIRRGAIVWDFEVHPGRFAHGKVLLYFWLGLFDGPPTTNLAASRLSNALFSILTGAAIYQLGRTLHKPISGIFALTIYMLLPLAFFFERMALADPFASGFVTVLAWRSLVFAKRPTLKQGAIVGVLVGLATLAKLTMGAVALLPVGATACFYDWRRGLWRFDRRYFRGLVMMVVTALMLWLPILIPALFAHLNGDPFIIVNEFNIQRGDSFAPRGPLDYLAADLPAVAEFTSLVLLAGAGLALVWMLYVLRWQALFLMFWLVSVSILVVLFARVITVRYLMPVATPLSLTLGLALGYMWLRRRLRPVIVALLATWALTFALPFANTEPKALSFSDSNQFDFHSGFFTADDVVREATAWLDSAPESGTVYATREACHLMYFYSNRLPLRCLDIDPIPTFGQILLNELRPGEVAYLVISGYYGPFHLGIDWLMSEELELSNPPQYQGPGYEFRVWKIWSER